MADSMSEAARELLEKFPMDYEFTMKEFENGVIRLCPKARFNLSHTIDRRLREYRHGKDYDIICIDPVKARYMKVKAGLNKRLIKRLIERKKAERKAA